MQFFENCVPERLVRPAGIEPATLGFGGQYSIHRATGASSKNGYLAIVSAYTPTL